MFITLVVAACGFAIAINWHSRNPSGQNIGAKDATVQPSLLEPARQELASHSKGKASQEQSSVQTSKSLFSDSSKQIAIAPPPLFPNLFPVQVTPSAKAIAQSQGDKLSTTNSSNPQSGATLPTRVNQNIPQDSATSPGQGLQKPLSEGVSPETSSENQPEISFLAPPAFEAKIVKNITPPGGEKVIALTFDDGPWPSNTLKILDTLKKNNVKATFFWVGLAVKDNPQIAKQVVAEGHAIGNHTWHHWYKRLDAATAAREIDDTAELIYKTTGVKTSLFRPPGAVMDNGVVDYAKQKKHVIVMWSNDPMDYRPLSANQLVKNVIRKAQPGAIVLMHDGGGNHSATVQALPQIITKLREQGYKFVTIPELLEMKRSPESEVMARKDSSSVDTTKP
jgi:peptidoglycan-N-acetylglucosamine deacetylase